MPNCLFTQDFPSIEGALVASFSLEPCSRGQFTQIFFLERNGFSIAHVGR